MTHSQLNSIIDHIRQEKPDLIVMSGDFVEYDPEPILLFKSNFMEVLLSQCEIRYGVYITLGNHDHKLSHSKKLIYDTLSTLPNVHFLERVDTNSDYSCVQKCITTHGDIKFEFIGFPDYHDVTFHEQYAQINQLYNKDVNHNTVRIIVSHNPDTTRLCLKDDWYFDLMLCGHTHGSQICIPIPYITESVRNWLYNYSNAQFPEKQKYRTVILDQGCFVPLHAILIKLYDMLNLSRETRGKLIQYRIMQKLLCILKYWAWGKGLVQFKTKQLQQSDGGSKYLYTSRGLATHPPCRLFCSPELTVIEMNIS
jgi:predicted MPP superfamily phosphohydrolase